MAIDKNLIFTMAYILFAVVLAILRVFGYSDWTPQPEIATLVNLLILAIPLVINLIFHTQQKEKIAELEQQVSYLDGYAKRLEAKGAGNAQTQAEHNP